MRERQERVYNLSLPPVPVVHTVPVVASWLLGISTACSLLMTPHAVAAERANAPSDRVPCWGDLERSEQGSSALPRFTRSVRKGACDPEILAASPEMTPAAPRTTARRPTVAARKTSLMHLAGLVPPRDDRILARTADSRRLFVEARKGSNPPPGTDHAVALNWQGKPVRPQKSARMTRYVTKDDDTIRSVAYRSASSPMAVAKANGLEWDSDGVPLPPGLELKVPQRFAPATGFSRAVRLTTGPGVLARRSNTGWGRPYVVRLLRDAFHAMHRRWPNRHPIVAHDLSRLGGGRLPPHKSHRGGRDIDIGYPTREPDREHWGQPPLDQIDYARLWFVIDRLEQSGLMAAIYMSPRIQVRLYAYAVGEAGADPARLAPMFQYPAGPAGRNTLIRHSPGHRDHLHMRFESPEDLEVIALPIPES